MASCTKMVPQGVLVLYVPCLRKRLVGKSNRHKKKISTPAVSPLAPRRLTVQPMRRRAVTAEGVCSYFVGIVVIKEKSPEIDNLRGTP